MEALLEQISESVQMADRRAGMEGVKALLTDVPASHAAFAAMGVPIMCAVLRDDADDLDLVQVRWAPSMSHSSQEYIPYPRACDTTLLPPLPLKAASLAQLARALVS